MFEITTFIIVFIYLLFKKKNIVWYNSVFSFVTYLKKSKIINNRSLLAPKQTNIYFFKKKKKKEKSKKKKWRTSCVWCGYHQRSIASQPLTEPNSIQDDDMCVKIILKWHVVKESLAFFALFIYCLLPQKKMINKMASLRRALVTVHRILNSTTTTNHISVTSPLRYL